MRFWRVTKLNPAQGAIEFSLAERRADAVVTAALVWPFVWLDRHVAAVRKHGYLLATVAIKPRP